MRYRLHISDAARRIEKLGLAEAALNQLAVPCFIKDSNLIYTHVNDAFCAFLGRSRNELVGHGVYSVSDAHHAEVYTDRDRQLLAEGGDQVYESSVLGAAGETRYVRFEKRRLQDEHGTVLGIAGVVIDVTEHKHTESKLRAGRRALRSALEASIHAMAKALEKRDPYTAGHQVRVAELSARIATKLGWSVDRVDGVRLAASVHDLGKLQIPAEILNRPGRLTDPEMALIREHAQSGLEILQDIPFPWPVAEMVGQHHERLDGTGYPRGLVDEEILPEAKVIAVADVFEAVTSHRPYRPARGVERALEVIKEGRGVKYDTKCCDILVQLVAARDVGWDLPD